MIAYGKNDFWKTICATVKVKRFKCTELVDTFNVASRWQFIENVI